MEKLKATSVRLIKDKWDFFSNEMNVTSIQEGVDILLEMFYYTFKDKDSFQLKKVVAKNKQNIVLAAPNTPTVVEKVAEPLVYQPPAPLQNKSTEYNDLISTIPTGTLPYHYDTFVKRLKLNELKLIKDDLIKIIQSRMTSRGAENIIINIERRIRKNI